MRIESVEFFYLSMTEVTTEADGSQDALLVRVRGGGFTGHGECEAAPLPSIAAFVCPMSHGVCRPVGASVLGRTLDGPADIARMAADVAYDSMDLLQTAHTWSGVEMALWDLLGQARGEPVWRLLGDSASNRRTPYASVLFGDTPQHTLERARAARGRGFRAAKFGWGPIGRGAAALDADHFAASAYEAYAALAARGSPVRTAGGEGAHDVAMARHLMDFGRVGFVQIDCGRIGGIGPARQVADLAVARGVTYVNHTFTTHLALSASLQPYAGHTPDAICEYPAEPKPLAVELTANRLERDADGSVAAPDAPGLGIEIDADAVRRYLLDVEIRVKGEVLYRTPTV